MQTQLLVARLRPFKQTAIAEFVRVDRNTAQSWYHGRTLPHERHWPRLAELLNVSVAELASIVAEDSKRRSLARVSEAVVA